MYAHRWRVQSQGLAVGSATTEAQRHPVRELLARYAAVLSAAWTQRDELVGPKRLADEQGFLPALTLQETPPHPAPRRFMVAICALFSMQLPEASGHLDTLPGWQGVAVQT